MLVGFAAVDCATAGNNTDSGKDAAADEHVFTKVVKPTGSLLLVREYNKDL
ncbi:hypothetical protein PC116_g27347 [Phytophthora cactorum]|nr:hypothetical protein PC116_g27347 [Phytophthora cactorum]